MTTVTFTVAGTPKPKGSLRHVGKHRLVEQVKGGPEWRETVAWAARRAIRNNPPLVGPLAANIIVYVPRPRTVQRAYPTSQHDGDADKHARAILDALTQGGVWGDDCQVVDLFVRQRYADQIAPGAHISISSIKEDS